jgi:hypothetical protein
MKIVRSNGFSHLIAKAITPTSKKMKRAAAHRNE